MRRAALCAVTVVLIAGCSEKKQSFDERYAAQEANLMELQNSLANEMQNRMDLGNEVNAP